MREMWRLTSPILYIVVAADVVMKLGGHLSQAQTQMGIGWVSAALWFLGIIVHVWAILVLVVSASVALSSNGKKGGRDERANK